MTIVGSGKAVDLSGVEGGYSLFASSPAQAHVGLRVHSNGTLDATESGSLDWNIDNGTWRYGGAASLYEVQFTKNSGDDPAGSALTTWHSASDSPEIHYSVTSIGHKVGSFTVKLRLASNGLVLATKSFNLGAHVESGV